MKKKEIVLFIILVMVLFAICVNTNSGNFIQHNISSSKITDRKNSKLEDDASRKEAPMIVDAMQLQNSDNPNMQDLFFLMEQLKQNHPDFEENKYLSSINKLDESIPEMDAISFNFAIRRILADMGDAHTNASFIEHSADRMVPIWQMKCYENKWYINGIHKALGDYIGYEIVDINGTPIRDIVEMAKPYISHETDSWVDVQFAEAIKNSSFLKYFKIIEDDFVIPMTLRNEDGELVKAKIETYAIDDYKQFELGVWVPQPNTGLYSGPNYYFKPVSDTVLFVQYSFCYEREDCSVSEWIVQMLDELKQGKYQTIIFDVRFNKGGMFSLFQPAVDAIGKYAKDNGIDLYCLISEETFSTGVMHAVQMKKYGAITVGRSTGGKVNFYADTINFELPNSSIPVSCSTKYNETLSKYTGVGLKPDIAVISRYVDVLQGIDSDIQAVISDIQ